MTDTFDFHIPFKEIHVYKFETDLINNLNKTPLTME